jgi:hypothetical protein
MEICQRRAWPWIEQFEFDQNVVAEEQLTYER